MGKVYVRFGSGWKSATKETGVEYISVKTVGKEENCYVDINPKTKEKKKVRLWVEVEGSEPKQVSSFTVFPNEIDHERYPTAPTHNVTAVFEE